MKLLTIEEFSKELKISKTTIYQWKRDGVLVPGVDYIKYKRYVRYLFSPTRLVRRNFKVIDIER